MKKKNLQPKSDPLLEDQYKNSRNLGHRAQLHQRFSSNSTGWFAWVFSYLNLKPGYEILECGAGPGWLWKNNINRLPDGCRITITDFSPGMVQEAKIGLKESGYDIEFQVADVQELKFADNRFDVVVANHMLYHVPNLDKAMREIKRVLKKDGCFVASTVGKDHMGEIRQVVSSLILDIKDAYDVYQSNFSMETGYAKLEPWFSTIERFKYDNSLRVTEAGPIVSYILSNSEIRPHFSAAKIDQLAHDIDSHIAEKGFFTVSTNSGLFRAIP